MPTHQSHISRLVQFGVIELDEVLEAMQQCPRGVHGLPFPLADEISNIEASSIRIPWFEDVSRPRSLLPGLFETSQIMQLLQVQNGNSVLLMGPRGNWWTELLMYIGAGHIVVLEPDEERRSVLMERWDELRMDLVANAFGCQINFIGTELLDECTPENGFDRILSTGMFPALPLSVMMRVQDEGLSLIHI